MHIAEADEVIDLYRAYKDANKTVGAEDPVNHPSHYTSSGIECIDAIKASMTHLEFLGYLRGNCLKYLWRYDKKGNDKNKRLEDLNKALWYLNKLIEEYAEYIPEC